MLQKDERIYNGFLTVRRTYNALVFDMEFYQWALGIAGRSKIKYQGWLSDSNYIMCFENEKSVDSFIKVWLLKKFKCFHTINVMDNRVDIRDSKWETIKG